MAVWALSFLHGNLFLVLKELFLHHLFGLTIRNDFNLRECEPKGDRRLMVYERKRKG